MNLRREDGFTSLCAVTFFGNTDVVRLLIDKGADVNAKTLLGSTAKSWASSRGFQEIVKLFEAAEKNQRAGVTKAVKPTENLASAESKSDLTGRLEPSTTLSAAEPIVVAAPIEPEDIKPAESVEGKLDRGAQVKARSEPSVISAELRQFPPRRFRQV